MTAPTDDDALRLAAIVASSDDAIVSKDLNGIVRSWNDAAQRMFGYTAEEMVGQSIRRIIPDDRQDEEDRVLASIRAGRRVEHFETIRQARDGRLVPISLSVSPIIDGSGRVIGASKIARDISDRKRAEEQLARASRRDAFLAEVTLTLTRSLDYHATLQALATIATPGIADYCAVDVAGEDGALGHVALSYFHPDSQIGEQIRDLFADPGLTVGPHAVWQTRRTRFVPEITDELVLASPPADATFLQRLRTLGVMSYVCVPLATHDRDLGAVTMANTRSRPRLNDDDCRLVGDVAARAALAVEIAQSHQELQTANRLKDEFLATLSHELRTPLNAVLGYSRMLQTGALTADRVPQALEVIDRNASALAQIVEDVLDVSRIILGKARLRVEPTDVVAVVEDALTTVAPAIEAKDLTLRKSFARGLDLMSADPSRLQQVVWNLLTNAVKFTPRGGRISVTVRADGSDVVISVADTGAGFSRAFQPHLFERFRQADSGPTRPHGGLGLGLAIARHLIEMHGGTIHASSEGEGKGATFTIRLPVAGIPEGAAEAQSGHLSASS